MGAKLGGKGVFWAVSGILYSHRLRNIVQQSVVELGFILTTSDGDADLSLSDHEAVLKEVAEGLGVQLKIERAAAGTQATFSR